MIQILVPVDDRAILCPRTDTEHKLSVGVDQIPNLDDCPIEFENDKEFLPHWAL